MGDAPAMLKSRIGPPNRLSRAEFMRTVEALFDRYGGYHRHPVNKAIHWVCVPLIVWSVLGILWSLSPIVAWIAIGAALAFYAWLSVPIAVGMAAVSAAMVYALSWLGDRTLVVSG